MLLRVAAGLAALILVALYEKLLNPQLALDFLADHQNLQVANQIGLGISDLDFVRAAGVIEVLFGLLLISGALPQVIVLAAGIPFNATLWFFGITSSSDTYLSTEPCWRCWCSGYIPNCGPRRMAGAHGNALETRTGATP